MRTKILFMGIMVSLFVANTATAQQQRDRTKSQTKPALSPTIKPSNAIKGYDNFSCRLTGLEMTSDGLGYFCKHKQSKYLIVFDGGNRPGGISATMSLLTSIKNGDLGGNTMVHNRVKAPSKEARRICDLIQGPGGRSNNVKCRQAISLGWRLINTGTASPSNPDIPTQDAKPSYPNIPTQDAKPD